MHMHWWQCLDGPVHRNAVPILLALSLAGAALLAALRHALAWARRVVGVLRRRLQPRPAPSSSAPSTSGRAPPVCPPWRRRPTRASSTSTRSSRWCWRRCSSCRSWAAPPSVSPACDAPAGTCRPGGRLAVAIVDGMPAELIEEAAPAPARHPRARRLDLLEPAARRHPATRARSSSAACARPSRPHGHLSDELDEIPLRLLSRRDGRGRGASRRAWPRPAATRSPPPTPTSARSSSSGGRLMELRVLALYPEQMNIYADRGNILFLRRRCEWRGIGFELRAAGPGEAVDPAAHDLFYIGGGQDRDQRVVAADMVASKRDALAAAVEDGAVAARRLRRLPAARPQLPARRGAAPGPRPRRPRDRPRARAAADRQRRDRGRPRRRPRAARRLREPRRPHPPRRRAPSRSAGSLTGFGNNGADGLEGVRRAQPDRHLPARPAAAQERLARRPPDRARARAPLRLAARARAARRRARGGRARERPGCGPDRLDD